MTEESAADGEVAGGREPVPTVLCERRGRVLVLTINRPAARNAVDKDVAFRIGDALDRADRDSDLGAVVLTGAGDVFCAGADLKAVARGEALRPDDPVRDSWGFAGYTRNPISKPTVAAVNGPAVGGGFELVLASDLAVASSSAFFALPETSRGIFAAAGGAVRLPAQLGPKLAAEVLLAGRRLRAMAAYRHGLVNAVVEPQDVLAAAVRCAARAAENPPEAVSAALRLARGAGRYTAPDEDSGWQLSAREWECLAALGARRRARERRGDGRSR
ncbi:enoyl-CoA hydratase-related protein [Streptomyces sp. UG1]|uniref:enoyl-CoA hydratase-related protein n=1 Tax=Streptomyces sp. UG1 TaxID=3417652 RepID=UPI003CF5C214